MEPTSKIGISSQGRPDQLRGKNQAAEIAGSGKSCPKEKNDSVVSPRGVDFVNIPQPPLDGDIAETLREAGNLLLELRAKIDGSLELARGLLSGNMPNADKVLELITEE